MSAPCDARTPYERPQRGTAPSLPDRMGSRVRGVFDMSLCFKSMECKSALVQSIRTFAARENMSIRSRSHSNCASYCEIQGASRRVCGGKPCGRQDAAASSSTGLNESRFRLPDTSIGALPGDHLVNPNCRKTKKPRDPEGPRSHWRKKRAFRMEVQPIRLFLRRGPKRTRARRSASRRIHPRNRRYEVGVVDGTSWRETDGLRPVTLLKGESDRIIPEHWN